MRTITTTIGLFTLTVLGCGGGSPSTTVDEAASLAGATSSPAEEAGAGGAVASDPTGGQAGDAAEPEGGEAGADPVPTTGGAASGGVEEPPATGGASGGAPLTGGDPGSGGVPPTTGGAASGGAEEPPATGGAQGGLGAGGASGGAPLTGGEPGSGGAAGGAGAGGLDSGGAGGAVGAAGPDCLWQEAVRVFPPTRFTWQSWEYVNEVEGTCSRCEGPICSELELSFANAPLAEGRQGFDVNVVQNRQFYMVTGCGAEPIAHEVVYPSVTTIYWTLVWSGTAWVADMDLDEYAAVSVSCRWLDEELGDYVDIPGREDMKTDFGLELADWIETIEWRCPL